MRYEKLPMVIVDDENVEVAAIRSYHPFSGKDEEAHRRGYAMAASFDLLAACKAMDFAFGYGSSATFDQRKQAIELNEKAIIKAKGKT